MSAGNLGAPDSYLAWVLLLLRFPFVFQLQDCVNSYGRVGGEGIILKKSKRLTPESEALGHL